MSVCPSTLLLIAERERERERIRRGWGSGGCREEMGASAHTHTTLPQEFTLTVGGDLIPLYPSSTSYCSSAIYSSPPPLSLSLSLSSFFFSFSVGSAAFLAMAAAAAAAEVEAPKPRSPPKYPDFCGRRRLQLELQTLNREVGFLQEELQSLEGLQPVSRCCKEVNEFVGTNPDPLIPVIKKKQGSCHILKWIGSKLCSPFSWICCCAGCSKQCWSCTCCSCTDLKNLCCCSCRCDCLRCCYPDFSCCQLPKCSCCKGVSCCTLLTCCCPWKLFRCCSSCSWTCCDRNRRCCCFRPWCSCPEYSCGCVLDCPKCAGLQLCSKCSKPCCVSGCFC